jgi:hypothetical protein
MLSDQNLTSEPHSHSIRINVLRIPLITFAFIEKPLNGMFPDKYTANNPRLPEKKADSVDLTRIYSYRRSMSHALSMKVFITAKRLNVAIEDREQINNN